MTVDSLARAEVRRFADEDTSERVRNEMMGVLGELLGISPEQMEELRSEDGQRRLHEGMKKFEGEVQDAIDKMMGGQVEALEFTAGPECRELLDKPMKDLPLKNGVLVGAIARDKEIVIPDGNTCIREGDHVVVVTKSMAADDLMDILK